MLRMDVWENPRVVAEICRVAFFLVISPSLSPAPSSHETIKQKSILPLVTRAVGTYSDLNVNPFPIPEMATAFARVL
jgi:hypothetical protein